MEYANTPITNAAQTAIIKISVAPMFTSPEQQLHSVYFIDIRINLGKHPTI